jgi:putative lipoic acid-binding regulatory protein
MNNINYIFVKPTDIIIKEFNDKDIKGVIEDFTLGVENNNVYLKESNAANYIEMFIPIEKFNELIKMYNEIIKHNQCKEQYKGRL